MRIDEILSRGGEPAFSFEFFPPKTPEGESNLYRALTELKPLDPAYVSVTYGAGGQGRRPPRGGGAPPLRRADSGRDRISSVVCSTKVKCAIASRSNSSL